MKLYAILLIGITCLPFYGQDYYFVTAKSGLNVRTESNVSSKKVARIPYGVHVEKIAHNDKEKTLYDNGIAIKGSWVKIKYNNYLYLVSKETTPFEDEGYVFDAYLEKIDNNETINTSKISKKEYDELKKKTSKLISKPKKIKSLDSIKTILKDRVIWVTQFKNGEYPRHDKIKSIIINNGQKLILNRDRNDFVFSPGWSGYYPDYEILVLEGGHSSDMTFSIKTGETTPTIGNPEYFSSSPKKSFRLTGYYEGQECITYLFQKNVNGEFVYFAPFNWKYDICTLKEFLWIDETSFIYDKGSIYKDSNNDIDTFYKGEIKI